MANIGILRPTRDGGWTGPIFFLAQEIGNGLARATVVPRHHGNLEPKPMQGLDGLRELGGKRGRPWGTTAHSSRGVVSLNLP